MVCEAEFVGNYTHAHDVIAIEEPCEVLLLSRENYTKLQAGSPEIYGVNIASREPWLRECCAQRLS